MNLNERKFRWIAVPISKPKTHPPQKRPVVAVARLTRSRKTKPNRVLQTPQNASLSNLAAVAARTEAMPCRVHTFYQLRPS